MQMLHSFFSSWELFHNTYLAGWLIGLALSVVGVIVVAQDQIFIGAAVAQASTLGVALGMWVGSLDPAGGTLARVGSDSALSFMAVLFSIAAALITGLVGKSGRESHEAITGWIFLLSTSVSVLVVSHSPHELEEIQRLVASSIIGATASDVWVFLTVFVLFALVLLLRNRLVLLLVMDATTASALGVRVGWWSAGVAVALGLSVGLSIRVSGMLYTFGFLVLPALVAKNLCREVRPMFIVAPMVSLAAGMTGFVLANYWDYPPGQMSVALLSAMVAAAWLVRGAGAVFGSKVSIR